MGALLYNATQRPGVYPRSPTSAEMLVLQGPRWDPSAGPLVSTVVGLDNTPVLLGCLLSSHFCSLLGCAVLMRQETEAQGG